MQQQMEQERSSFIVQKSPTILSDGAVYHE